ncbi:hypothetical protein GW537_10000 [Piscirickettsia salmonis]|nr:hypothetical protein GW538_06510 [Piscirickettsia salmonis]QHS30587.1 hypothetical protein GW537_10000 [Piscirickettsia salmonis]
MSQLNTANLTGATLTGANLTGANCAGTRFLLTNFQNAIVSGVDLKDSLLINPNLTGTGLGPENLTDSIVSFVPVESENYRNSLKLLIKIHSLKTVYARPTDICAITHLSGSEIKSPVYIKKSNGDFDCYDREALKTWIREGNVINPLTRELITPEMLSEVPWTPEFFWQVLFQRLLQQVDSESPSSSPSSGAGFNG